MRKQQLFNEKWSFTKANATCTAIPSGAVQITLPHTWNAKDGTDGGNDYYRGTCWYHKNFARPDLAKGEQLWIEFRGVAMTAEVFLNGKKLAHHDGGYSTFRAELTDALEDENLLAVSVDNSINDRVYPQKADFTFYGGIYRDVYLITVPAVHFSLDYFGSSALRITPVLSDDLSSATVTAEAWVTGETDTVNFTIADQTICAAIKDNHAEARVVLPDVHLWNGLDDPYLYEASVSLDSGDQVFARFGCRSFHIDPNQGFFLNGRSYPLCGAARHQDREGLGSALTKKEHEEDIAIALEMGCNTLRLAHYQHDQFFYDLCDEKGLIVWAEIPYISEHLPNARENSISQMTELVVQNYNHPSIICWGLSNEITAAGGVKPDTVENHQILNELCHRMDKTRLTTMAHAFMLDEDDPFVMLSDIRSYNLYYGWYLGQLDDNDQWFDEFHRKHPEAVIGLSEYGADANPAYQSPRPEQGDWTESYQAVYHEHMLKMWEQRPYIWAMHVWNLFDFAADGRDEGGKPGQNQKGLVTFDRKTRKDAFYLYKAYLSHDAFVHIAGRRYVDRTEAETEIKVYSNQPVVELLVDGKTAGVQEGSHVFRFLIPITGEHSITAISGSLTDTIRIRKVDEPNPDYRTEGSEVVNWFDKPQELTREGYYSILDSMEEIKRSPEGKELVLSVIAEARKAYGDVAKSVKMPESVQKLQDRASFQSLLKKASKSIPPARVMEINERLNHIKRVEE